MVGYDIEITYDLISQQVFIFKRVKQSSTVPKKTSTALFLTLREERLGQVLMLLLLFPF